MLHTLEPETESPMIRIETQHGWWLVTHSDHARLAAAIAREWGNESFRRPEPRTSLLSAIQRHEDAMHPLDQTPEITADGQPLGFSHEMLGKKLPLDGASLDQNLALRTQAVRLVAADDPYAALLIAMQTEHELAHLADRSALTAQQDSLLDQFLDEEVRFRDQLRLEIEEDPFIAARQKTTHWIGENFALFQAWDRLSMLLCLSLNGAAPEQGTGHLPALPQQSGKAISVRVESPGPRHFRLDPWPLAQPELRLELAARQVIGRQFSGRGTLADAYNAAPEERFIVRLSA